MKTLQKALQGAAVVAAVVASASVAKADLTLQGAVGLPLNPTAQIPEQGAVRVQGNYTELGSSSKLYGLYAAGRVADNIEVNGGIEKLDVSGGYKRSGVAFGGKYLFTRESDPAGVRLAAGAGYSRAQLNNTYGYVVASKYFGAIANGRVPITGHLGLRYDRFDYGLFGAGRSNKLSVYAGAEVPVTRNGNLAVVGELQSKVVKFSGASAPYSLSVRYRPQNQGFSASVGLMRRGILSNDSRVFAQLGYTFGGSVAESEGAVATTATPSPSDTTTTTSSTTTATP